MKGKELQSKVAMCFLIIGVLSEIISILLFCFLTHDIFDLVAFEGRKAAICIILSFGASLLFFIRILIGGDYHLKTEIATTVLNTAIWIYLLFKKWNHITYAFTNGYITVYMSHLLKLLFLINISGCIIQGVFLMVLLARAQSEHSHTNTADGLSEDNSTKLP